MKKLLCIFTILSSFSSLEIHTGAGPRRHRPKESRLVMRQPRMSFNPFKVIKYIGKTIIGFVMAKVGAKPKQKTALCNKHKMHVDITNPDFACSLNHKHLPQTDAEAITAANDMGRAVKMPSGKLVGRGNEQFVTTLDDAYKITLDKPKEHQLTNAQLNHLPNSTQRIDTSEQTPHDTTNTDIATLAEAAHNDIEANTHPTLPKVTSDMLEPVLTEVRHTVDPTSPKNSHSYCQAIQENLVFNAREKALSLDAPATINTTMTCLAINNAIQEAGPMMYTQQADACIMQVAELHTVTGAIMATGLDHTHPEIAAHLIAGDNNCNLPLIPYLQETLSNLDPRCYAALRGIRAGASNFAGGIVQTIAHPIETAEKIILTADKIIWIVNHFVCNDITLKVQRDALLFLEAHEISSQATQNYLCGLITHIENYQDMPTAVDAYSTVHNLSSDQIKSAFSEAQQYVSSEEGVERCFTVGTELGLGWLTAQGIGGVLGSAGEAAQTMRTATNVPQGVLMAGDGVVVAVEAAEAEAIANGIRTVGGALGRAAQVAGPASLVSQRRSDRQSQRGSERPPQDQINSSVGGTEKYDDSSHNERLSNLPEEKITELSKSKKICEKSTKHMFADREGHLTDTPANRQLLVDTASNIRNYIGPDKHGTDWFSKIIETGEQVWVGVRNGSIRYGGLNKTPRAHNSVSGFSRLRPPSK